jgi:hypothetical protein
MQANDNQDIPLDESGLDLELGDESDTGNSLKELEN